MRQRRKTKVQPSQKNRVPKPAPKRPPGSHYRTSSYYRAVQEACKKAGVPSWGTHQIRHATGTNVRKKYGLEGAQVALGHEHAKTTEIYAEKNQDLAKQIAEKLG